MNPRMTANEVEALIKSHAFGYRSPVTTRDVWLCSGVDYVTSLQEHVFAEIQSEVAENMDADKRIVLKATSRVRKGRVELSIKDDALDFDPHLLVVKAIPSGMLCVLKRVKEAFHVETEDDSVLCSADGTSFEIVAGLSEYTKQLCALFSKDLLPYLLDGSNPPHLDFTGWEKWTGPGGLDEFQAKAVQRYLNTTDGVMLLEGPPGTGKSHTISVLVTCLVDTPGGRVVVITAPSNKAVESIAEKLTCDFRIVARKEKITKEDLHHRIIECRDVVKCGTRVILCTMSKCYQLSSVLTDVELIIDEAGQASQPLTLVPFLLRPRRCLMVGDIHQLRPLVRHDHAKEHHFNMSMMERLQQLSEAEGILVPRLSSCYRSAQEIIDFSNNEFYNGDLVSVGKKDLLKQEGIDLPPLCMIDVPRQRPSADFVNKPEIRDIRDALKWFKTRPGIDITKDVIVLCFYKNQLVELDLSLRRKKLEVPGASVDSFQGGEKKIVFISFSKSCGGAGFLDEANRLNVALTRAQHSVVLFGDHKFLSKVGKGNILGRLMKYVEDLQVRKSLRQCLMCSDVTFILKDVDEETLVGNFFQPLRLSFEQALIMKKIEARSMSSTVHAELVSRACDVIGYETDQARKIVGHYTTRSYGSIQDVEEGSDLHIFCKLRDFHALDFSRPRYEEKLAEFQHLSSVVSGEYLRLMAKSTALWIRYRLSVDTTEYGAIIEEYHALDDEYRAAGLSGTQHLLKGGMVLLRLGEHRQAIKVLKRVAELEDATVHALNFDDVYAARCMIAEALHGLNAKDKKVKLYLHRAKELSKLYSMQRAWSFELLAGSFMDEENYGEALTQAKAAMMRNPGNAHAYLIYLRAERLGKVKSARH